MAEEITLYKILAIREVTDISPEGVFIKLMEVECETASGIKGTIRIPKEEFTKEKVAELVSKEAREIEEALKLRE